MNIKFELIAHDVYELLAPIPLMLIKRFRLKLTVQHQARPRMQTFARHFCLLILFLSLILIDARFCCASYSTLA